MYKMQNLFIEIKDGKPYAHPLHEDNLLYLDPSIQLPNEKYMKFIRAPIPKHGIYEVVDGSTYEIKNGVVEETWNIRQMDAETKAELIAKYKVDSKRFDSWIWEDETCSYIPPVLPPPYVEGVNIHWNESKLSWEETPPSPGDGYIFDPRTAVWIKP